MKEKKWVVEVFILSFMLSAFFSGLSSYLSNFNVYTNNIRVEEIQNAFGKNGYTPSNHSGATYETAISINIGEHLKVGYQRLIVRSADAIPNNLSNCAENTGVAKASVVVIGFVSNK